MAGGHAIEVLSFEVEFATEGQARAQHMRFGDFAAGRGLAVIEEVFDEFAGAADTVRLDSLEVDLGETPEAWDDAEAEARLREALRRALRAAIGPRPESGARAAVGGAPAADLEAVWAFLHGGVLPWNLTSLDRDAFEDLVRRVVAGHGGALADRLRRAPAPLQARMIARLVRQWPRGATEALAQRVGVDPERLAALPPPATAPDAWTEQLNTGIGAPIGWSQDVAATSASLDEAAWPRLINGEPAAVRARLTALGRHPENRARFAALLTDARQRQVLSLWAAAPDVDFLQALFAAPHAWRLGGSGDETERLRTLREGLLAHVLALPGKTLDVASAVEALVTSRARADGLAPSRVAQALVAGWPGEGAAAAAHARLRAALFSRGLVTGPDPAGPDPVGPEPIAPAAADVNSSTGAPDDARSQDDKPPRRPTSAPDGEPSDMPGPQARSWRFEVGAPGDPATGEPSDSAWNRRVRLEPAGLAEQLRRLGRTAAARRRLAQDLTPARLADVLALWAEPADAAFVLAVVADAEPWLLGGPHAPAHMAQRLHQWLLDTLLTAPPGAPRTAADLILTLVHRRAAYDDLAARTVAAALLQGSPTDPVVHARLRQILAVPAGEPAADRTLGTDVALAATASDPSSPDATPPESGEHHPAPSPAPSPPPLDPSDARATLLTALAAYDAAAAEPLLRRSLATDRVWLDTPLREHARDGRLIGAFAAGLPPALLFDLAQPHLSEPALRLLLVAAPGRDTATLWADVLTALWSDTPAGPLTAAALARRLRRSGDAATFATDLRAAGAYLRDTPPTTLSISIDSPDAVPPANLAAWRGRLPERPNAATIRAISALLAPAATGLRALATYAEAERHSLVLSLRPADAPAALAAVRTLTTAAEAAALSPPPEGWSTFGWRTILRELFEEERPFEAAGFARRWFDAWAATTPPGVAEAARARLASTLDTLPTDLGLQTANATDPSATALTAPRHAEAPQPAPPEARQPRGGDTPPSAATGAAPIPPPHNPDQNASADAGQNPTEPPARTNLSTNPDAAAPSGPDQPPAAHTTPTSVPADADNSPPASADAPEPTPPRDGPAPAPADSSPAVDVPSPEDAPPNASATQPTATELAAPRRDEPPPADTPDPRDLAAALRPTHTTTPGADPASEPDTDRVVYVDNAGLVLAGPFIPALFARLELTRAGGFVDERARERAIHILQFLVDGDEEAAPEHRLALNKLVCGLDFAIPIGRDFRITDSERATVEDLLRVMVERWPALGRTSIAGLRETFLIRRGALRPQDDTWRLTIEPGPFDMLLDQLPWGYGVLKSPWMTQVLHVDWR